MAQFVLNTLTLSNINRFSKFFHCQNENRKKICNNVITEDPTTHDSDSERILKIVYYYFDKVKVFNTNCAILWPTLYCVGARWRR